MVSSGMRIFSRAILAAAILVSSCSLQKLIEPPGRPAVKPYQNPHTACAVCHGTDKPQPGPALFVAGVDPSDACLLCHDYKENHHPTDFAPADPSQFSFPLFDGKVKCLSCHEIHGGQAHGGTARLLRGGPYEDRREICFRCHSRERYGRINPHVMLDEEKRFRLVNGKPVCLVCHAKMPDPEKDVTTTVQFRADVGFLCWRCHPPMPDPFFSTHFLIKPKAAMLELMYETEEAEMVIFPLVPRGRITCSTCHNPHQAGVIQREGAAKGADARARLRTTTLCYACHRI